LEQRVEKCKREKQEKGQCNVYVKGKRRSVGGAAVEGDGDDDAE
jgi:hypothetical protein